MSEINENYEATTEAETAEVETGDYDIPDMSGAEGLIGGAIGLGIGAFVGNKMSKVKNHFDEKAVEDRIVKQLAEELGAKPEELKKALAKRNKVEKKKKGKICFRNPFYREEVEESDQTKKSVETTSEKDD